MENKTPQLPAPELEIIELDERLDLAPDMFSLLADRPQPTCGGTNGSCCNNCPC
jgi:hypothetical protein